MNHDRHADPAARNRSLVLRILRRALVPIALAALALAAPALAQLGPFRPSEPYWFNGFSDGCEIQSGEIWVDVDGSGTNNAGDTHHPIPSGMATGWELKLTPSRAVMVAFTSTGQACPQATTIRLYSIPATDHASLVPLGEEHLDHCIAEAGFYEAPDAQYVTGFFRDGAGVGNPAKIVWWNLVTGEHAASPFNYLSGFGPVTFAPSGTMAWLQHGINEPLGSYYSLVELCPGWIGRASQPGLNQQPGGLTASVETGTSGAPLVEIRNGSTHVAAMNYADCTLPPPPVGACCVPDGGCVPGLLQDECEIDYAGEWQGPDSPCQAGTCPEPLAPQLGVSKSGPASVPRGYEVTYTLDAANTGTGPAGAVTVTDDLPQLTQFISASNGGTYDPFTRRVTWTLGALGAGASVPLTLTISAPCIGTSLVNGTYAISGSPGGTVVGAPAVTTTLTAPAATALQFSFTSLALAPVPLHTGDRVRHTVQLTNTLAQSRQGVRMLFSGGALSTIVAIVDSGGGTVTGLPFPQWSGTIGPNASVSIVWETEIKECRPATAGTEALNGGNPIVATDRCGTFLGFATATQTIAVAPRPVDLVIASPSHGPIQSWVSGPVLNEAIVARPGATIDFEMRIVRTDPGPAPNCDMGVTFPAELTPVGDPPFIGTPPAGTAWDPLLRRITWSGAAPATTADTIVVGFRGQLDASGCLASLNVVGGYGSCPGSLLHALQVVVVHEPPNGAHVVGLSAQAGLYTWIPGGSQWQPLMCGSFGGLAGLGRTDDGTLWVAGNPSFRLNPGTLAFQILPGSLLQAMDMDYPFDAAQDPRDGTVVFSGYKSGYGLRLRRYDPANGQVQVLLNDHSPMTYGPGANVTVNADGTIGVQYQGGVLRVDPAAPASYVALTSPAFPQVSAMGADTDGNYLVVESTVSVRRLVVVDRLAGTFTPIVDLAPSFGMGASVYGVAAIPGGDVFAGDAAGGFGVVHRGAGSAIDMLTGLLDIADLHYVDGPPITDVSGPTGEAPAALALAAPVPNPFTSGTTLGFALPARGPVSLDVYDLAGRRVRVLEQGERDAGRHAAHWDGRDEAGNPVRAGLYFARLRFGAETLKTRLVLAR